MDLAHQGKVTREIRQHLFLIGLDRVQKRNAFDSYMIEDLSNALTQYENDPNLRCAIIFAHGEHFTAGLDLIQLQPKLKDGIFNFTSDQIDPWGTSGRRRTKPVVVAVEGLCYTAGIELMLNADVVISSEEAQFSQLEVLRGIMPFGGATVRFIQAAGWQRAMPYLLTGKLFDAKTAYQLNLVSELVPKGNTLLRAMEWANDIALAAPMGVRGVIQSAKDAVMSSETAAFEKFQQYLEPMISSKDAIEGAMAMVQKRPPQFRGE